MFKVHDQSEQYIERENDYGNTETNNYIACVYAQLSVGQCSTDGAPVPVQDYRF